MAVGGVPLETVAALLMLPLLATLVAFARQIVGLKGFNIFTPLIIAFVLREVGLEYGLTIFALVVVSGLVARLILKRWRLQYLPRIALIITVVTAAVLAMFFAAMFFDRLGFIEVSLLPVLVLVALAEQFAAVHIEHGAKVALALTLEAALLALAGFGLLSWPALTSLVLQYPLPYFVIVIGLNIILGRWTGLRLLEVWRFRALLGKRDQS